MEDKRKKGNMRGGSEGGGGERGVRDEEEGRVRQTKGEGR